MTADARLGLTVSESTPVHPTEAKPAPGAPNVVAVVLDDTGFAQLGCFGSDIATPNIDRLAHGGLRYNRFHVTALCSPTRASFFTGRNHHAVGMGFLADLPMGYPGYTSRLPKSAAPLPRLLRDAGYSTLAVGKWHLTPRWERSAAGPFDRWPLGMGFERYYGFLQGDANHWAPNLVCDNHYVDPPGGPEDGYHLSEDLASTAIGYVLDQQQAAPGKPFFLYFALGAMHAPHHVAPEWVAPYRGRYDRGWDDWREEAFARQVSAGVVPEGTVLTPRPPWVDEWSSLPDDERRMHARQQEVFAGFLTHTDAQIGRLVSFLESRGLLEDTLVLLFSDNGASAEGGRAGSVNEHRFTARVPESVADNLAALDDWGGPRTYNHYSWGWAWAGNTPLRLWKRYTWLGGTRTPLVVHWPRRVERTGEVRSAFTHVVDLLPTVLEAVGIEPPEVVDGVTQQPVDGSSLVPTFDDPGAADVHETQYFEMLGSRAIFHAGWKATDRPHLGRRPRRGGDGRGEPPVRGRPVGPVRPGRRLLRVDRRRRRQPRPPPPARGPVVGRGGSQRRAAHRRHPGEPAQRPRAPGLAGRAGPHLRPGRGPGGRRVDPAVVRGVHHHRRRRGPGRRAPRASCARWATGTAATPCSSTTGTWSSPSPGPGTCSRSPATVRWTRPPGRCRSPAGSSPAAGGRSPSSTTTRRSADLAFEGALPIAIQHGGAGLRLGRDTGLPVSTRYRPPAPWNGTLLAVRVETPGGQAPGPAAEVRGALHSE